LPRIAGTETIVLILALLIPRPATASDPFAERRDALREDLGKGVAIVWGRRGDDFELRGQRPDFAYLTGIDQPDAALLLLPGGKRLRQRGPKLTEVLYLPRRDPEAEQWTGKKLGPGEEAEAATGIEAVHDVERLDDQLERFLRGETTLFVSGEMAGVREPLTADQAWVNRIEAHEVFLEIEDLSPRIDALRQRKSEEEIDRIRRAVEITGTAFDAAARMIAPGVHEYQVESTVEYHFRYRGADGPAFDTIAASGPNSTVLHYSKNDRRMEAGDLLILDIGARWRGYAADVTRTFPVSGRFSDEQAEIYDIVLEAQRLAIERVRPGALYREDVDAAARDHIEKAGYGDAFIHGTGHFVGLDVHDVGDYEVPLEPGMVLTVEPGIYLPEKGFGVRIEDVVLVTESGNEVLSAGIPRRREEIEAAMAGEAVPTP
jgi:Xaa-Pro aminopeptidase